MARLITAGAEGGHPHVDNSTTITGSFTAVTTAAAIRSGSYGYNASSGAGNAAAWASYSGLGGALNRNYYIRAYVKIPSGTGYPTANTRIISFQDTNPTATAQVRLNTDGTVNLVGGGGGTIGSASSALSQDAWHLIELRVQLKVGNDEAELKVDNVAVASTTTTAFSDTNPGRVIFGMIDAPGANKTLYFDDLAVNDDQGASENTWPNANGKIVALLPVSISAKGTWAGGAGGTTDADMLTAVNTRPPAGTASETDSTQIECSTSAGSTITYVTGTYTAAGIGASDTITLIQVVAETGEDASTGSETAFVGASSNPSVTEGSALFGPSGGGALGTYPTNWGVVQSAITYAPSPTLGTGASITMRKSNTSNRVYSCCFLAAMVEYVPVAVNTLTRTVAQTAHILTTLTRSITQTARISTAAVTRTVPQTAAIADTKIRDVPQTGHILVTNTRTVSQTGHILSTETRSVPQTGRISVAGLTRDVPQTASLADTRTRDVPQTGDIIVPTINTRDVPQSAHVLVVNTRSVTQAVAILTQLTRSVAQTASISTAGLARSVPQTASLSERLTRTVPQEAVISGSLARDVPQTAHILVVSTRDVTQTGHILETLSRAVVQSAHVAVIVTRDVPQDAAISVAGLSRTVPQEAVISVPTFDPVDTEGYLHIGEDTGIVLPRVHSGLVKRG